jgi:hypothetical protein
MVARAGKPMGKDANRCASGAEAVRFRGRRVRRAGRFRHGDEWAGRAEQSDPAAI